MTLNWLLDGIPTYMLVFCRMSGMVLFNPMLSRKNVPSQVRVALVLGLTLLLSPGLAASTPVMTNSFSFILLMTKEMAIGLACGLVFQFFYYMLFMAGDLIDMGFGLSMAKVFDPGTNLQISMSGNLFQLLFVLYLFTTDSHLALVKLFAASYDLVGIGTVNIGAHIGQFLCTLFITAFSLSMKLAIPFIAASFVLELAMGILMKLIPQINVFVIHFQLKIILGFVLMFLFAVPMSNFIENYIQIMLVNTQEMIAAFR